MSPTATSLQRAAPAVFVVIWATGFIVARLVSPHAEPLTFLVARFGLTILVLAAIALSLGQSWPTTWAGWRNALVAGVLMQGLYLGGVFWSVRHGLPAGIAALVTSLQPLLTGVLATPLLGETVTARRWMGIGLGFIGAAGVLAPKLGAGLAPLPLAVCCGAMASMTLGTIWQKRTGSPDHLVSGAVIQFLGALTVIGPLAALTEGGQFDNTWPMWIGLLWSVFGLSVGAILILLVLLRRGAVAQVAALLYLVPPVAAVMAFILFGETLSLVQIVGMAIAAAGVALASRA
jgi:drug/metabolite transporter (DMT)-like permease